jgi:hypothetical protein
VSTNLAPAYPRALDELLPTAYHSHEKVCEQPDRSKPQPIKSRLRMAAAFTELALAI